MVDPATAEVQVMFNYTFDEACHWKHVACRLLPPACLPEALAADGPTAFEVTCGDEWILKGAVAAGVDLTVPRLRQICLSLQVALPPPKKGSGKNGAMKKEDYVRSLIKHLWPECTPEWFQEVFAKMMKLKKEKVDLNVLAMVAELDTENQEAFKKLKDHAMFELESKVFGQGKLSTLNQLDKEQAEKLVKDGEAKAKKIQSDEKAKQSAENMRQWGQTPPELRKLLPGGGTIAGVFWMRWHATQHWWRVTYPTGIPEDVLVCFCLNVFLLILLRLS